MARRPLPLRTLEWMIRRAMFWKPVQRVRALNSGLLFYADLRDFAGRHIWKYGAYEPHFTAWMARHLQTSSGKGIVVDVGAQIGWFTLHAAIAPNVSAVVACEPDAHNAYLLDRNIGANRIENVVVAPWAIGAASGTAQLYQYKPSNIGRHSLLADYGKGSRTVPLLDLDATLASLGLDQEPIHLLKVDVEGYELEVIRGAAKALGRTAVIFLEFSPHLMPAGAAGELVDRLFDAGFSPFTLSLDGKMSGIEREQLAALQGLRDLIWTRRD